METVSLGELDLQNKTENFVRSLLEGAAVNWMKKCDGTEYHQENQMAYEIDKCFERMRDEVLTGVHALVELQSEAPPVEVS